MERTVLKEKGRPLGVMLGWGLKHTTPSKLFATRMFMLGIQGGSWAEIWQLQDFVTEFKSILTIG